MFETSLSFIMIALNNIIVSSNLVQLVFNYALQLLLPYKAPVLLQMTLSAQNLKSWTCEAYVKLVCVQSDSYHRLHDRNEYHQNTMDSNLEYASTLVISECKHALRHLNYTGSPQRKAFEYSSSFAFFGDNQKQRRIGIEQPPLRITKLNTFCYGAFVWITNS